VDARGVTADYSYDDFLRLTEIDYTGPGSSFETKTFGYDRRGLMTGASDLHDNSDLDSSILRSYDGNRQPLTEALTLASGGWQLNPEWDAAGRRRRLSMGSASAGQGLGSGTNTTFGYRADGLMTSLTNAGQTF